MKLHSLFISAILLCTASIHASWVKPQPLKIEPIPGILFPHGNTLDNPAYLIGVSYLGGAAGQIERRVATSGVIPTRSTVKPSSGKTISAHSPWANGFQIDFCGSTEGAGSNSFWLNYSLLSAIGKSSTTNSPAASSNILSSFALNNATGATGIVSSVTSQYIMHTLQDGALTYSKSCIANNYLSLLIIGGIHGFGINHKLKTSYTDISGNVTNLIMKEITYGAGPLIGFSSTKKIADIFALRGSLFASAPLSNHSMTQSDYYESADVRTYGYNVASVNQLRQHLVAHLDLEALFRTEFLTGACFEFLLAWHVKQYINQSYLTAMSNNQNAAPSTIQVNTVKAGFTFIF